MDLLSEYQNVLSGNTLIEHIMQLDSCLTDDHEAERDHLCSPGLGTRT